jgi:hypothetical protein
MSATNGIPAQLDPDGAPYVDRAGVERSFEATTAELRRLRRRRTKLHVAAAAGLVVTAGRAVVALQLGVLEVLLLDVAIGVALTLAIHAFIRAIRAGERIKDLEQEIFTLRFLRDVLELEGGPGVLRLSQPYRAAPGAARAGDGQPASGGAGRERSGWVATWRPILGTATLSVLAALGVLLLAWLGTGKSPTEPRTWMFLEDVSDPRSLGFHTPTMAAGEWVLQFHEDATGARALVNLAGAPQARPATAVVDRPTPRDLQLGARCKVSAERPEQACGVVFRYRDHGTHYVARVDAAAALVMLGVVVGGVERRIHAEAAEVEPSRWHDLAVQARADHIVVTWNGRKVIDVRDPTLSDQGAVGLWAPADCVAYFDELTVQALPPVLSPAELLLFKL